MIDAILRRPVSVFVATAALCALGLFSLAKLPLSLLPSIERPKLIVIAKADARSREEMLHGVTQPIERRMSSIPGIASIESETADGESRIELGSAWQTDPDRLRIDVARRVEGASEVAVDELSIDVAGSDVSPVVEVAIPGREPIRLHDDRKSEFTGCDDGVCAACRVACAVPRSGNAVTSHEVFREDLAAFELRRRARRTEYPQPSRSKKIDDPFIEG